MVRWWWWWWWWQMEERHGVRSFCRRRCDIFFFNYRYWRAILSRYDCTLIYVSLSLSFLFNCFFWFYCVAALQISQRIFRNGELKLAYSLNRKNLARPRRSENPLEDPGPIDQTRRFRDEKAHREVAAARASVSRSPLSLSNLFRSCLDRSITGRLRRCGSTANSSRQRPLTAQPLTFKFLL